MSIESLSKITKLDENTLWSMPLIRLARDNLITFETNVSPKIIKLIPPDDPITFQKAVKDKHKQFMDRKKK